MVLLVFGSGETVMVYQIANTMYYTSLFAQMYIYTFRSHHESGPQVEFRNEMEKQELLHSREIKPRCLEKTVAWNEKLEIRMHMCYSL